MISGFILLIPVSARTTLVPGQPRNLDERQCRKDGCCRCQKQLLEFAAAKLGLNITYDLDIKDCFVYITNRPERGLSYYDVVKDAIRGKDGQTLLAAVTTPRTAKV